MRWLTFGICAVLVVTLQLTIAPRMEWGGARPDWCLVFLVFFALHARSADALIGAWMVGAVLDLMTIGRLGLLSLSYGLAALAVYAVRDHVYADHPLTHLFVTLAAGLMIRSAHGVYQFVLYSQTGASWSGIVARGVWAACYSAVWAPPFHAVFLKFPRVFGIRDALGRRRGRL